MPKLRPVVDTFLLAFLGAGAFVGAVGEAADGSERRIAQLEKQVANLRESYALARTDADEARREVRQVRARLEALGGAALGDSEEKLIETVSQLESARSELDALRQSSLRLSSAVSVYARSALVEDAAARQELDAAVQDLDVALGFRQAQQRELSGSVDNATVLSIDAESGLIVINAGRAAKVEVGMPMEITRGDQIIANAVVTDVRKSVAGMLVQRHLNPTLKVSVGDRVSVKSND